MRAVCHDRDGCAGQRVEVPLFIVYVTSAYFGLQLAAVIFYLSNVQQQQLNQSTLTLTLPL